MTPAGERDQVIERIVRHPRELEQLGVQHRSLFGSIARGEGRGDSDVDLLADMRPLGLLALLHVQNFLSDVVGREST
ncbi:MAG TPA: nucleotidyltransferase domain-containing protein [Solirubrobacteraceae bacterium]|nr:nucleotidyltransferase domain-containing protein [Solirubrobacteraceae bacterium]